MADPASLNAARAGSEAWNAYVAERGGSKGADLAGANLVTAKLARARFQGTKLVGADLSQADLRRANLRGADLRGADLRGADLRGADLTAADLPEADLRAANLAGADLTGADLTRADLSAADLTGSYLSVADLTGAILTGADLTQADARKADLTGAALTGANLSGAELADADLTGTDLTGADITRANLSDELPDQKVIDAVLRLQRLQALLQSRGHLSVLPADHISFDMIGPGKTPLTGKLLPVPTATVSVRLEVLLPEDVPLEELADVLESVRHLSRVAERVGARLSPVPRTGDGDVATTVATATSDSAPLRVHQVHYGSPFIIEILEPVQSLAPYAGGAWAALDLRRGLDSRLVSTLLTLLRPAEREAWLNRRAHEAHAKATEAQIRLEEGKKTLRDLESGGTSDRAPTATIAEAAEIVRTSDGNAEALAELEAALPATEAVLRRPLSLVVNRTPAAPDDDGDLPGNAT